MFENAPNLINIISENPSETTGSLNPSKLSEDMDHVTPDQPQNFDTNLDSDSSEDELIRTYIFINRSKTPDPATFKELQDSSCWNFKPHLMHLHYYYALSLIPLMHLFGPIRQL